MEKKLQLLVNLVLLTFALIICNQAIGQTTTEAEKDADNLRKVTQYFYDHDFIVQMANDKTIKLDVYHIKKNRDQYSWPTTEMRKDAVACRNSLYLVDVTTKDRAMKYLYCTDIAVIKLTSTYELKSEKWTKLK